MKKIVFATNNAHKLQEVSEILEDKIQILKHQDEKSRHSQTSRDKIQILKLQIVKSKHLQILGV